MTLPLDVALLLTQENRTSVAAVLAVVEASLPPSRVRGRAVTRLEDAFDADVLGFSFCSGQREAVRAALAGLRTAAPRVKTLAGGPHATAASVDALALGFDWVCPGEAGLPLVELLEGLAGGTAVASGVLASGRAEPLDRYPPWPADGSLFCRLEITRGCCQRCAFCQTPRIHGEALRHRSLAQLLACLREAVRTGHTFTRFVTPNAFAYGARHSRRLAPEAVEGLLRGAREVGMQKIYFGCFPSEVRPESVTEELLAITARYCVNDHIVVGLQSGSDAELRRLHRGHNVVEGLEAVARIAAAGFRPVVDFIFGTPGQSSEDQRCSRELIGELTGRHGALINTHHFEALPGTPLAGLPPAPLDEETRALMRGLIRRGAALPPRSRGVTKAM